MKSSECRVIHIRRDNLLDNSGNSMQLYKAVVYLRCILALDPVTHRKLQNDSKEERKEKIFNERVLKFILH